MRTPFLAISVCLGLLLPAIDVSADSVTTFAGTTRMSNNGCAVAGFFFTLTGYELPSGFWVMPLVVADKTATIHCIGAAANVLGGFWNEELGGCVVDPGWSVYACLDNPLVVAIDAVTYNVVLCGDIGCAQGVITLNFARGDSGVQESLAYGALAELQAEHDPAANQGHGNLGTVR